MKRTDFSYELPRELIAQEPRPRGRSRMMVVKPEIEHRLFSDFPQFLEAGELLVINDTRVIPARLYAQPKGQMKNRIEFLLVRQRDAMTWETWCKPAKVSHVLRFAPDPVFGPEEGRQFPPAPGFEQ